MDFIGRTFIYDYGDVQIRTTFLTESRLRWECLAGPTAGQTGEENFQVTTVRPRIVFVAWQETDKTVVAQVIDWANMRVHSSITTPEREFYYLHGTLRAAE